MKGNYMKLSESQKRWDAYFLDLAKHASSKSKDDTKQVGAAIVGRGNNLLASGFNGFPREVTDDCKTVPERYNTKEVKYAWIVHAEQNAICAASREGVKLNKSTIYCSEIPCATCLKLILQAGIRRIVFIESDSYATLIQKQAVGTSWKAQAYLFMQECISEINQNLKNKKQKKKCIKIHVYSTESRKKFIKQFAVMKHMGEPCKYSNHNIDYPTLCQDKPTALKRNINDTH